MRSAATTVARLSGIRTAWPVIVAHVMCSMLAATRRRSCSPRLGVGSPTVGTQGGYDLLSIAAVVLGGTLLGRSRLHLGHHRRRRDLRGRRQRHERHAGQPVPEGRRPRHRHRRRRRRLHRARDRERPTFAPGSGRTPDAQPPSATAPPVGRRVNRRPPRRDRPARVASRRARCPLQPSRRGVPPAGRSCWSPSPS